MPFRPRLLSVFVLAATLAAQVPPPTSVAPPRDQVFDSVLHAASEPDRPIAVGADWKASFGAEGFVYVPRFAATAPRNFPVHCTVRNLRIGGEDIAFDRDVAATRDGDCYRYVRGPLHEVYDVASTHVKQSFVVDSPVPGEVELALAFATDLQPEWASDHLRFVNGFGAVVCRDAVLWRDGERIPLPLTWRRGLLTLTVPAALRGEGPLWIDPIWNTEPTPTGINQADGSPDVAWDESNRTWLVVWEFPWSATDFDIASQMFDADGYRIPGSARAVDASQLQCRHPRVANSNAANAFVIVFERSDPAVAGGRSLIHSIARGADPLAGLGVLRSVSAPSLPGNAHTPDIGGDSGTGSPNDPIPLVWLQGSGGNLHLRWLDATGAALSSPIQVALRSEPFAGLRISKSNGRGRVTTPTWLAVFSMQMSNQAHDIVAVTIRPTVGAGTPNSIQASANDDRNPSVTIPIEIGGNSPTFAVGYERITGSEARVIVYEPLGAGIRSDRSLAALGIGPYAFRLQSDGLRFACTSSWNALDVAVSTLAHDRTSHTWVLQDGPLVLAGQPTNPSLCCTAAGGSGFTEYGVVYVDEANGNGRTTLTRYNGYADGPLLSAANTACGGLSMSWTGLPWLGNQVGFPMSGQGATDLPCFAFGEPTANPLPLCGSCQIGLRTDRPLQFFPGLSQLTFTIPPRLDLIGLTFAVQGFTVGSGPCLGGIATADTWWMTIR